jgi:putative ABC transport system permease protein
MRQWFGQLRRSLAALLHRDRLDRELEEEMQAHLEFQAAENRQNGMPAAEARQAARRRFGNSTFLKEESRGVWGWRWVEVLAQDIRFALRLMRRSPTFAATAVLTLGLAIGGNTLVFSLVDAVVLRPLPFADPARLYLLATVEAESQQAMNSSYPDFRDWRAQSRSFQAMAAFRGDSFNLTGAAEPKNVNSLCTTPGLFELLGVQPALGRPFAAADGDQVVLLSHRLWVRQFGADPGIVGRVARLDGRPYTVLGILPEGFHFPLRRFRGDHDVFVPLIPSLDRTTWELSVLGRLRPGATEQQARVEMDGIARRLAQAYPESRSRQGIAIRPLERDVVSSSRETAAMLMGAVGFVLLIACGNVANLLLSQGAARKREIAIRLAIGASRGRVVRQLLMESVLLAALGAAVGVLLARWGLPLMVRLVPERTTFYTRVHDYGVHINLAVLAFTGAVSLAAAVLFGALPALKSTAPGASARFGRQGGLRGALIAFEVSLAFVLLAGAGLMMNSMWRLLSVDLGFRADHLLTMDITLPEVKYPNPKSWPDFFAQATDRVGNLPGVISAGASDDFPLSRAYSINTVGIPGVTDKGRAAFHRVTESYLSTMGTPLVRGRLFTPADSEQSAAVVVINRTMAARFWPNADPIGKTVMVARRVVRSDGGGKRIAFVRQPVAIVGVVGDVRLLAVDREPIPEVFFPYRQWPQIGMSLVARTAANPSSLVPVIQKEIWRMDADLPLSEVRTMDDVFARDVAERHFVLLLVGVFALMAVVLSAVGIGGVVSYNVRRRTQEIGIRVALGASGRDVVWLVMRQTALWMLLGMAAGTAGAMALTRLLSKYLYHVKPTDPATFALAAAALVGIALAADAIPARRAARIDPVGALRYE